MIDRIVLGRIVEKTIFIKNKINFLIQIPSERIELEEKELKEKNIKFEKKEEKKEKIIKYPERTKIEWAPKVYKIKNCNVIGTKFFGHYQESIIKNKKLINLRYIGTRPGVKSDPVMLRFLIPKKTILKGNTLLIGTQNNYYHWMFDKLPKIELVKLFEKNIDYYIVGQNYPHEIKSIEKIIPKEKILKLENSNYRCENLFLMKDCSWKEIQPKKVIKILRKSFLKKTKKKPTKKIYVKRGNVRKRNILNEKKIINYLKKKGFSIIDPSNHSIEEQAKIFNSAKTIVAPHGAALTNIVFCEKGTKLIEIFNPDYKAYWFLNLTKQMKMKHEYIVGKESKNTKLDYTVDIEEIKKII